MTHFICLVAARNEDELAALLLPYHEYECTGIKAYLEWVPEDMGELNEAHQKYHPEMTFDEFVPDWCGATKNEKGEWGRMTNPNKRWDWWVIGGRFSNRLILHDGTTASWANNADIDWEAIKQNILDIRAQHWDKWQSRPEGEIDINWLLENEFGLLDKEEEADLNGPKEKYVRLHPLAVSYVDLDGKWNQAYRVGWWSTTSEHEPDYPQRFWEFIESLPSDINVYTVDCHI